MQFRVESKSLGRAEICESFAEKSDLMSRMESELRVKGLPSDVKWNPLKPILKRAKPAGRRTTRDRKRSSKR